MRNKMQCVERIRFGVLGLGLILAGSAVSVGSAQAEEKKAEERKSDSILDSFMCKKMRDAKLSDLKLGLIEDCNLSKPFSISEADIAVNSSYTYCCHKK